VRRPGARRECGFELSDGDAAWFISDVAREWARTADPSTLDGRCVVRAICSNPKGFFTVVVWGGADSIRVACFVGQAVLDEGHARAVQAFTRGRPKEASRGGGGANRGMVSELDVGPPSAPGRARG